MPVNPTPAKVTVTGILGLDGVTTYTWTFTGVNTLNIDYFKNVLTITHDAGVSTIDYTKFATVTYTITNGVAAVAFS
jgi:hypothetical protein